MSDQDDSNNMREASNPTSSDFPLHTNSKVGRLIETYDLHGLGEELEQYWTTDTKDRYSLRQLADLFNCRLLQSTMENADMNPLDGEVDNTYRLLTDDEVSAGSRTQAASTLKQHGINVDQLTTDFVSHQAIHTYLTQYRDVKHSSEPSSHNDSIETRLQAIQRLTSRLQAVTTKHLQTLRDTNRITLGTFTVLVDVHVFCEECGTRRSIRELLNSGGCECDR